MTEDRLPLADLLAKAGDGDFLRSVAEAVVQLLMETDVEGLIGAGRHERSGERTTYRNGYRDRTLDTRLGSLQLRIPKLRQGSYFPPFLEPRKTSEKALVAVIQEAWVSGVSTRRVDDLVQAMGLSGISKSTVSKLCKDIDDRVNAFLDRPLVGDWPYLWLDATYLKQREGGRIVSVAAIIAVAANTDGKREIVGLHIGPSEAETFWATFLKSLVRRGLARGEARHLRCPRGPQGRNPPGHGRVLATVPRALDAQRPILRRQRSAEHGVGRPAPGVHPGGPGKRQPDAPPHRRPAARESGRSWRLFIDDSETDVLAHMDFPAQHRTKIHSTNPIERLNKEVKRRAGRRRHLPKRGRHHPPRRRRPAGTKRRVADPAPLHADRSHGRTYTGTGRGVSTPDRHRRRMNRGHLSQHRNSTTLTDVTTCPTMTLPLAGCGEKWLRQQSPARRSRPLPLRTGNRRQVVEAHYQIATAPQRDDLRLIFRHGTPDNQRQNGVSRRCC